MLRRMIVIVLCGVTALLGVTFGTVLPQAAAATCSDVEVVFARGTAEPSPPVGLTGVSFAQSLRTQLRGKSLTTYGVKYPASADFRNRLALARTVVAGVKDTQNRVKYLAKVCPRSRIVIGGYSQGAVVAGYATSAKVQLPAPYVRYTGALPAPLPADVARHVAAVVLFAPPSARFLRDAGAPAATVGPLYRAKTLRYCIPGDNICNGAPLAGPGPVHVLYSVNGLTFDAARRVAARL